MIRCARCGRLENCELFTVHAVALCEECVSLVIAEWWLNTQAELNELFYKHGLGSDFQPGCCTVHSPVAFSEVIRVCQECRVYWHRKGFIHRGNFGDGELMQS